MMNILIYILSAIACLYIAYYIYNDDWDEYIGGGSTEATCMIFMAFIPIGNSIFAIIIGVNLMIKKIKEQ